jgi:hypothetical protein
LNLWEWDRHFLGWMQEEKFFSGKFVYENGKIESYSWSFY